MSLPLAARKGGGTGGTQLPRNPWPKVLRQGYYFGGLMNRKEKRDAVPWYLFVNLIFSFLPLFSNLHKLEENPPAVIRHNPRAVFNLDKDPLEHPSNRHAAQLHQKIFNLKPSEEHLVENWARLKIHLFTWVPCFQQLSSSCTRWSTWASTGQRGCRRSEWPSCRWLRGLRKR